MSKKLVEEIIWEQLAPILEELAPIDAELLVEGVEDMTPEAIEKAIKAFDINQKDFEKTLESGAVEDDVRLFREYAEKIEGNTVENKIKNLAQFLELDEELRARIVVDDPEKAEKQKDPLTGIKDISKIISKIIYIKTIAKVLNKFDATTAGKLMEPVFTSLGGSRSALKGGKDTLVDFQVGEDLYSLKFLKEAKIEGSYGLLKKILLEGKEIKYIVALKSSLSDNRSDIVINFRELTLRRGNFFNIMGDKGWKFYPSALKEPDPSTEQSASDEIPKGVERLFHTLNYTLGSQQLRKNSKSIKSLFVSYALAKKFNIKDEQFKNKIISLIPEERTEARAAIEAIFNEENFIKSFAEEILEGEGKDNRGNYYPWLSADSLRPDDDAVDKVVDLFKKIEIEDDTLSFGGVKQDKTNMQTNFNKLLSQEIGKNFSIQNISKSLVDLEEMKNFIPTGSTFLTPRFLVAISGRDEGGGGIKDIVDAAGSKRFKAEPFRNAVKILKKYFGQMKEEQDKNIFKFLLVISAIRARGTKASYVSSSSDIFDKITKTKTKTEHIKNKDLIEKGLDYVNLTGLLAASKEEGFEDALRRSIFTGAALVTPNSFDTHSVPIARIEINTEKIVDVIEKLLKTQQSLLATNLKRYGYIQQQYQEMAINLSKFYNNGMKINKHAEDSKNNATEIINTIGTK